MPPYERAMAAQPTSRAEARQVIRHRAPWFRGVIVAPGTGRSGMRRATSLDGRNPGYWGIAPWFRGYPLTPQSYRPLNIVGYVDALIYAAE